MQYEDSLLNPKYLKKFLGDNHLPPLERFGQNFLIDLFVLEDIVNACETNPQRPVIEVGSGFGVLSRALAAKRADSENPSPIYSIEFDRRVVPILKNLVKDFPTIKVIENDILRVYPDSLIEQQEYEVAGNIPYNITSKIIKHVLSWNPKPKSVTFLVDYEVAKRVTAQPGELSILALSVQVYAEPRIVGNYIPPIAFMPVPKINSAILRMELRDQPLVSKEEEKEFFRLLKGGFSQKRKTLLNSLRAFWQLDSKEAEKIFKLAGIDPTRRPQTLSIEEWKKLLEESQK